MNLYAHTSSTCWSSGGVSSLRLVGCGFDTWLSHSMDCKNDPIGTQYSGLEFGGLDHRMIAGRGTHRSLRGLIVSLSLSLFVRS